MFSKIYHHKWFPRIFYKKPDGGKESGVTGYFLIEWKSLFSIGILHFKKGSREAYHSHAFNAITWWLNGSVFEEKLDHNKVSTFKQFKGSIKPKYTPRNNTHKVIANKDTWALTFRGPWKDYWYELDKNKMNKIILTHGREKINA